MRRMQHALKTNVLEMTKIKINNVCTSVQRMDNTNISSDSEKEIYLDMRREECTKFYNLKVEIKIINS